MEILRVFNAVGECLFALVDFKYFLKISCHSIFAELFVSISFPISSQFICNAIEKYFYLRGRTNLLALLFPDQCHTGQ